MMPELLLTAVIFCSTGDAQCTSYELDEYTLVHVCDIAPEEEGEQRKARGFIDGKAYVVTIDAKCVEI